MTTIIQQEPEDLLLLGATDPLDWSYALDAETTGRELLVELDGVPVFLWTGGVAAFNPGYAGTFTSTLTSLALSLSAVPTWVHGVPAVWSTTYRETGRPDLVHTGRFVYVDVTTILLSPNPSSSGVPARTSLYASFELLAGTPTGVDFEVDGELGEPPNFLHQEGGVGTTAFGSVLPRRAFRRGALVSVLARPVAEFVNTPYRGRVPYTFTVSERPALPGIASSLDRPLSAPLAETLRQEALSALRAGEMSPPIATMLAWLVCRSTVGQVVRDRFRDVPSLLPEDVPDFARLLRFVQSSIPLWTSIFDAHAPPEYREALMDAWRSGHAVERAGALAVILVLAGDVRGA